MPWPKGKKRGYKIGGRVVGSKNKLTQEIREMIRGALEDAGGQAYLVRQAHEKPAAFLALLGRLVPAEVKAEASVDRPIQVKVITGFEKGPHAR